MSPLRQRMIEQMQLENKSKKTIESYVFTVVLLAKHYNKCPSKITNEQLRSFLLGQINSMAASTVNQRCCALKYFYRHVIFYEMPCLEQFKPQGGKVKLRTVLETSEVKALLNAVRLDRHRLVFTMMYCCGLRISEAVNLKVQHIDLERLQVFVFEGKGQKDRIVPLPKTLAGLLIQYFEVKAKSEWAFPSQKGKKAMRADTLQRCFQLVVKEITLLKDVKPHSLRHSIATHLLERGMSLLYVRNFLGHKNIATTMIYLHLTKEGIQDAIQTQENLCRALYE
ncbi:MAG: site-specific integrase [Lentisphaeraceae bacterium]|nr:site-specific integrase [Lentisphaeraceae bacterium]